MKITYISAPGLRGAAVTQARGEEYKENIKKYFENVDSDYVYIGAKKNTINFLVAEAENHFDYIHVDEMHTQRDISNEFFIIRCGKNGDAPAPATMTNEMSYVKWLAMQFFIDEIDCIYSKMSVDVMEMQNKAKINNKKMNMIER